MRTQKQIEASRLNGAKSRGPATPEGKRRSSQEIQRHSLFARSLALQLDDKARLRDILAELTADLQPANLTELGLVETMAISCWKELRFLCSEKIAIDLQVHVISPSTTHMTEYRRSLREMDLHNARVSREHDRALMQILKLQDRRGFKPGPVCQPDAKPLVPGESEPKQPAKDSEPKDPGGIAGILANKKITARTHHTLKTNDRPQVQSTQPETEIPLARQQEGPSVLTEPATALPEFPAGFTNNLRDKKITARTCHPLKTNNLPQVRSAHPGAETGPLPAIAAQGSNKRDPDLDRLQSVAPLQSLDRSEQPQSDINTSEKPHPPATSPPASESPQHHQYRFGLLERAPELNARRHGIGCDH